MQLLAELEYSKHYQKIAKTLSVLKGERDLLKLKLNPNPATSLIANADAVDQYDDAKPSRCLNLFCCRPAKSNSSRMQLELKNLQITALEEIQTKLAALNTFRQPKGETWGETFEQMGVVLSAISTYGVDGALNDPCMIAFQDLKTTLNKYDENSLVMQGAFSSTKRIINGLKKLVVEVPYIIHDDTSAPSRQKH